MLRFFSFTFVLTFRVFGVFGVENSQIVRCPLLIVEVEVVVSVVFMSTKVKLQLTTKFKEDNIPRVVFSLSKPDRILHPAHSK
jgi:hypothetical protein